MKFQKVKLSMDTVVNIQAHSGQMDNEEAQTMINHAFEAFYKVEQACSRFTLDSELMMASAIIEEPVQVSPYLFEPLKFALEMAKMTNGLFDPTIGKTMESFGFNRHYLTGELISSVADNRVTYKDIILDKKQRTALFKKRMVIDLGAVAKGFAIDLAASALKDFDGYLVNAGGDIYGGGLDEDGNKWKIGIQHPYQKDQVIHMIELSNEAICTSGSYERKSTTRQGIHHIVNPKTEQSPHDWISCSVIAPFTMMADAFSTTAFLLGKKRGEEMIENVGVRGICITPELQMVRVGGI